MDSSRIRTTPAWRPWSGTLSPLTCILRRLEGLSLAAARLSKGRARVGILLVATICALGLFAPVATATGTINVDSTVDAHLTAGATTCASTAGGCTLRAAIALANQSGGTTTINVPAGTYTLSLGELQAGESAGENISIVGAGSASTTITQTNSSCTMSTGSNCARVFNLDPNVLGNVSVSLSGLTITGGVGTIFGGGAISAGGAGDAVTISNCVLTGNQTANNQGGGAINFGGGGNLTITNSTISNNTAQLSAAGGISYLNSPGEAGNLTITGSTIANNTATSQNGSPIAGEGGGLLVILASGGTATITSSTFTGNTAQSQTNLPSEGGAIYAANGTLNLSFNRIAGNSAASGSGIWNSGGATVSAADNWWGCNTGPNSTGCDSIGGAATSGPWLILGLTASPSSIKSGATSTLTADLTRNSNNQVVSGGHLADGTPVTFAGAGGTVNPINATTTSGTATSVFTAGNSTTTGNASATVDNATASTTITIGQLGDVNGDGHVTAVDALCVLRIVAGLPGTSGCPIPPPGNPIVATTTPPETAPTAIDALCILRGVVSLPATANCPLITPSSSPAGTAAPADNSR